MFIYPDNLKAKPMLWLWLLRDIAVIGVAVLLSVLALSQGPRHGAAGRHGAVEPESKRQFYAFEAR